MTSQTWITAAIGAITVIGAYLGVRLQRPKIEAEAQQIIGATYSKMITDLRLEIDKIKTDLEYERQRNYALERWSKALSLQVVELGARPVLYEDYKVK